MISEGNSTQKGNTGATARPAEEKAIAGRPSDNVQLIGQQLMGQLDWGLPENCGPHPPTRHGVCIVRIELIMICISIFSRGRISRHSTKALGLERLTDGLGEKRHVDSDLW